MGSGDAKETKRQVKGLKRKQNKKEGQDKIKKRCQSDDLLMMSKFEMTPKEAEYESLCGLPPPPGEPMFLDLDSVDPSEKEEDDTQQEEIKTKRKISKENLKRNLLAIPNTSEASIRYGLSSTQTAAIASAYLLDLIDGGQLTQEAKSVTLDSSKVKRGRDKVTSKAKENGDEKSLTDNIEGILADGRKDKTMVRTFNRETGRYHVRIKKGKSCDHSF